MIIPTPSAPVGREAELNRLEAAFAAVANGASRGRAMLVTGPAGVGKSRLMAALRQRLRERGDPLIEGRCRPTDHRPHGALTDLLGAGAARLADLGRKSTATDGALDLIAGLTSAHGDAAARTLHFFDSVRAALVEIGAGRQAGAVFLHDLHHADTTTLKLTRYLLENLLADPAFDWATEGQDLDGDRFHGLLVVSFRQSDDTEILLEAGRASAMVEHLPLGPLDREGVRAYLATDLVVDRILAASGGMPAALEALLDAVPADAAAARGLRIAAVPAEARPLLEVLAVYRTPCTAEALRDLTHSKVDLRAILTDLCNRGVLIRSRVGGAVRFRFAANGSRATYLEQMTPENRAATHRQLAERLAVVSGLGAEPEEIAFHYLAGDAAAEAVPFALEAAARLRDACAFGRAARLLERVVPVADGPLRAQILDQLVDLYAGAGETDRARETLAVLRDVAGDDTIWLRLARLHLMANDPAAARAVALSAPKDAGADVLRALAAVAAEAAYQEGDLDGAVGLAEPLCQETDDAVCMDARNTLGKVHLAREALDESQTFFELNLESARAQKDPGNESRALINLGIVHLQRGSPDEALTWFETARQHCEQTGDQRRLALAVENLAVLHHRRQAYGLALACYHQSTATFRQLGQSTQLATAALNLADLYVTVGDRARARRLSKIAGDLVRQHRLRSLEAQALLVEGELARAEGDLGSAAERFDSAAALLEGGSGNNQRIGPLLHAQGELALERGDLNSAREALERATNLGLSDQGLMVRLRTLRGGLALADGNAEQAVAELTVAAERAEDGTDSEAEWRALSRLAEAHWQADDRAGTLQSLAAAVDLFEREADKLPGKLRTTYLEAPARRGVRDALRRVRAGLPPNAAPTQTRDSLARTSAQYRSEWTARYPKLIGRAPSLYPVFRALDRVAGSDSMVLIRGESGTGKELVAGALHTHSPRASGPFVKVNCGAFVETLLLSELFGHEKGAFTGAVSSKKGRFELADKGTLFLDEIGDVSTNTQIALLRVLQERKFERVGGSDTLSVDVRLICATHRDLEQMVRDGTFRADLYYRLRGVIIELPPLRDRRTDIPRLSEHFLSRRAKASRRPLAFAPEALASLMQHDWPGNIRELENVVRSVALFADGNTIGLPELIELGDIFQVPDERSMLALSEAVKKRAAAESAAESADRAPTAIEEPLPPVLTDDWLERMLEEEGSLSDLKKRIEFEAISRALRESQGNITQAAGKLGMKRPRLSQIIHATPALGELKREVSGS